MAKNNGMDTKMDKVQIITKDIIADDTFWGLRLFAEYTMILYLKKRKSE